MELQQKIKERRCHPLGNKSWKEGLYHQESTLDKKLREKVSMEEKNEREAGGALTLSYVPGGGN